MNSDFSAARARLDAAEAKREEVLLRHIANGVMIESRTCLLYTSDAADE